MQLRFDLLVIFLSRLASSKLNLISEKIKTFSAIFSKTEQISKGPFASVYRPSAREVLTFKFETPCVLQELAN